MCGEALVRVLGAQESVFVHRAVKSPPSSRDRTSGEELAEPRAQVRHVRCAPGPVKAQGAKLSEACLAKEGGAPCFVGAEVAPARNFGHHHLRRGESLRMALHAEPPAGLPPLRPAQRAKYYSRAHTLGTPETKARGGG